MGAAGFGQTQAVKLKQMTIKKHTAGWDRGKSIGGVPSRPINKSVAKDVSARRCSSCAWTCKCPVRTIVRCQFTEWPALYASCQENSKFWLGCDNTCLTGVFDLGHTIFLLLGRLFLLDRPVSLAVLLRRDWLRWR